MSRGGLEKIFAFGLKEETSIHSTGNAANPPPSSRPTHVPIRLASRRRLFEFLDIMEERGELSEDFAPIERRFSYHPPCHLRAQGIGLPSFNFLQRIPGLSIENLAAGCCGMSGSFGFKGDKYEISMKVGEKVFERIAEVGADTVVSDCGTCRLQIRHGSGRATCHPIEILAQAYGYK